MERTSRLTTATCQQLLDRFQRDFPLESRPFARIAEQLGATEAEVLDSLQAFSQQGVISRVGPVFSANCVGRSTLAALAVPESELVAVAELINSYEAVNHNYEREHKYNLWFVVTAEGREEIDQILNQIEQRTGLEVLDLPMLDDFHIDLGFPLWQEAI